MKKALSHILSFVLGVMFLASCSWICPEEIPIRRVFVMYAAAYSNLSESIREDVEELSEGQLPTLNSGDVVLIYSHFAGPGNNTSIPTESALYRIYKDKSGSTVRDTLQVYPATEISGSAAMLNKVLTQVKELYPSPSYGMLFSSHAKGWLPVDYKETGSSFFGPRRSPYNGPEKEYPLTKEIGIEFVDGSGIDIRDFADAIPMKLDFCILDACLMGCVEVAYELKDKCDLLLVSPTEILSNGMVYTTMGPKLFNVAQPDLKGICKEYFDYYKAQSGYYQSATITLVDCPRTEELAKTCAAIVSAHRDGLATTDRKSVQPDFYNNLHWFYDLRDLMEKAGADEAEMSALDSALGNCIVYKAATDTFFDLELISVCGLSVYFPNSAWSNLNDYYKTLAWNKATHLVQ
jgi:hypothetical protein